MSETLFIGRDAQIEWLNDQIFTINPSQGYSCSLRGPNGIGKTFLKNHLCDEFRDKLDKANNHSTFIIDYCMRNVSYHRLLLEILQQAAEYLDENTLKNAPKYNEFSIQKLLPYIKKLQNISSIGKEEESNIDNLFSKFFALTSSLGFYFILIIDEFDLARDFFPEETDDGLLFNKLFEISAKSGRIKLLSIILISRRRAGTIAHHMSSGSDFDAAYPSQETTLKGFNNEEMNQYYSSYANLDCGILPEGIKDIINFYCGRHPDMLMQVRAHIRVHCKTLESIDIASYYRDNGSCIRNTYRRMYRLLNSEYVDRINRIPAISAFNQAFNIVPAYDINLSSQIDLLNDFGFLMPSEQTEGVPENDLAPDSLKSSKMFRFDYEPIAQGFVYFVKENASTLQKNEIHQLIDTTEAKFRVFLQKHLFEIYGSEWQSTIDLSMFKKEDYWENLNENAAKYGAFERGVTVSVLDVLAFFNLAFIVKQNWEQLKAFFPSFQSKNTLYNNCFTLTTYRNCCFHGTLKILGYEQIRDLKEICKKIITDIDQTAENTQGENATYDINTSIQDQHKTTLPLSGAQLEDRNRLINSICVFICQERKQRGNLVGCLDNGFPASISPTNAKLLNDPNPVGKSFKVQLVQWDNGPMAQKYNVIPIE